MRGRLARARLAARRRHVSRQDGEHLGQSIAYGRMNGVVSWSR
jgi:hypothetical protein